MTVLTGVTFKLAVAGRSVRCVCCVVRPWVFSSCVVFCCVRFCLFCSQFTKDWLFDITRQICFNLLHFPLYLVRSTSLGMFVCLFVACLVAVVLSLVFVWWTIFVIYLVFVFLFAFEGVFEVGGGNAKRGQGTGSFVDENYADCMFCSRCCFLFEWSECFTVCVGLGYFPFVLCACNVSKGQTAIVCAQGLLVVVVFSCCCVNCLLCRHGR